MIDKKYFYDNFPYRPLSETGVNTINNIINYFDEDEKYTNLQQLAYVLATAYHESAFTWNPSIEEYGKGKTHTYGLPHKITGQKYYGRGLCQLTWYFNYESFSKILGIDLVNQPELALEPKNSVNILMIGMRDGIFTKRKLNMFFNEKIIDWYNARTIVNGHDKASLIQGYAEKFLKCITIKDGN